MSYSEAFHSKAAIIVRENTDKAKSQQEINVTFSEVRKKINSVDKDIRRVKNVNNDGVS